MRLLLCTSQDIGPRLVRYFSERPDLELLVVTQHTRRDRLYKHKSTAAECARLNVQSISPKRMDSEFIERVREYGPDLIISCYYPKIFPRQLIDIPRLGAVNVHPGDLPRYRGCFAIPWAIINGEKEITATLHYVDEGIDSGCVLAKDSFRTSGTETGYELYWKAMYFCGSLVMSRFDDLVSGRLSAIPQEGYGSYYSSLESRYQIDWQQSGEYIERRVRVHAMPYLPAFAYIDNICVYINKAEYFLPASGSSGPIGRVVQTSDDGTFCVSCSDGTIRVLEWQTYPALSEEECKAIIFESASFQ